MVLYKTNLEQIRINLYNIYFVGSNYNLYLQIVIRKQQKLYCSVDSLFDQLGIIVASFQFNSRTGNAALCSWERQFTHSIYWH